MTDTPLPLDRAWDGPVVLASANPAKVAELRDIVGSALELIPRPAEVPEVIEDADTFIGNARLKAYALVAATGRAALADDSGLEVDGLGGAPGVWSARYAGEHATDQANVNKLLDALAALEGGEGGGGGDALRRARYRCVVVFATPEGHEVVADGTVEGQIAPAPRGPGGFGYDPIFVPDEGDGRTFGELDPAFKHSISHRGRAVDQLLTSLRSAAPPT